MKHFTFQFRRLAALGLALTMTASNVWATAGNTKLQTVTELVDGLVYRNTVSENNGKRVESYSFTLSPDSQAQAILLQGDETIYGGGSIDRAVASARERGYYVLGAVNTDFFNTANGVPLGLVIEDGIYQSSNYLENALTIGADGVALVEAPEVSLSLYNVSRDTTIVPHHFNKSRNATGGMYLYNKAFSGVSTRSDGAGWYVRLRLASAEELAAWTAADEEPLLPVGDTITTEENADLQEWFPATESEDSTTEAQTSYAFTEQAFSGETELTVNSTLYLVVSEVLTSDKAVSIGADEYILTAAEQSGCWDEFYSFQVGDLVTLTTACDDPALSNAQWACGVGDIMVRDGELTDSASWNYNKDGRQPRTAVGIRADGTLELYAVDGRQSTHSVGLTQMDLATELQSRGCVWVANLDGGGSTALSAWLPGGETVTLQNSPSDGNQRRCASYLLFVTEAGDGEPSRLALMQEGQTVLVGSTLSLPYTVTLDTALSYTDVEPQGLTVTSLTGLGTVTDGIYTAGATAGTETLLLRADGLEGTAQLHVVDTLTELTLRRAEQSEPLTSLRVLTGGRIDLTVTGSYWNRLALRDFSGVVWSVEGDVGTVDERGRFVASRQAAEGSITCTAGGLSQTVQVTVVDRHADIQPGHWAYDAVEFCYENGIVNGISLTEFGGTSSIRRADFILMLYNAVGKPATDFVCSFTDVEPGTYFYDAVAWAEELGLATGMGDGRFAPADSVTREQAFTLFYRFLHSQAVSLTEGTAEVLDSYLDGGDVIGYAQLPTATLVASGLVQGSGDCLNPKNILNRAEMATLMCRVMRFAPEQLPCGDGEDGIPGVADAPEPEPIPEPEPEPIPEPEPSEPRIGQVTGISTFLRVRAGAGSDYEVVGQLSADATVEIVEELEEWYVIRYTSAEAGVGYVSKAYITLAETE